MPCNVNRYLADELAYLLTNADAKALFFDVTLADRVAEVRDVPRSPVDDPGRGRRAD